jgi:putative Mg2+ transporter-C (MgtC) family protein
MGTTSYGIWRRAASLLERQAVLEAFQLPDLDHFLTLVARLVIAAVLGGFLGFERERLGKPAGLRTHVLVALGSAVFVAASLEAGVSPNDLTRVVQGVATGIGFVGAGAILKSESHERVHGLTTAASVWLTAAVGMAVGAGRVWVPVVATLLALLVLSAGRRFEQWLGARMKRPGGAD